MPPKSPAKTIVLIHGLFMTPRSWEGWAERYRAAGYEVLLPSWPGLEAGVEALKADPTPIAGLGLGDVIDHFDRIIRALPSPPILIGHSLGGSVVQVLLSRGLGAAGVALHTAMVQGVFALPLTTIWAALPILWNPFRFSQAVAYTPKQFRYAFTNNYDEAGSLAIYEKQAVPATARALFQGALTNLSPGSPLRVNFRNPKRAPLLLVGGTRDQLLPPFLQKETLHRYRKNPSVTEYKQYEGRSHFTAGEPGWEVVADEVLAWAAAH